MLCLMCISPRDLVSRPDIMDETVPHRTDGPVFTKLGMYNRGLLPIIVCTHDDRGVNLTFFTTRSNFVLWEKVKTLDFSEITAPCDLKVCRCRQLIEFMKVCEY